MKRREKLILGGIGGLALVVLLAGALLVVLPQRSKADQVDRRIATANAQFVALHRSGVGAPTVDAASVFDLRRAMPDTDDMPDALVELSRLARVSSAQLTSVQPSPAVPLPNGSSALPVKLTVDGSWGAVVGFLARLRNEIAPQGGRYQVHGRLFEVDSVQITPSTHGLEALLTVAAFDYGTPPPPAPPGTTTTTTTTTPAPSSQQAAAAPAGGS